MSNKIKLEFDGFDEISRSLAKLNGSIKTTADKALRDVHRYVTDNVQREISVYKKNSGDLFSSLVDKPEISWYGDTALVGVGFDYEVSVHALFMMITGTPYLPPNKKLYNSIYGAQTKKAIQNIERDVFVASLRDVMK